MNDTSITSLVYVLQEAGFSVGIEQIVAAQDLLLLLAAEDNLNDARGLQTRLAPIFCQNLREQKQFYQIFQAWQKDFLPQKKSREGVEVSEAETEPTDLEQWGRFSDPKLWLAVGLTLALLGGLIYENLIRKPVYPLISLKGVVADTSSIPIPFAEISLSGITPDYISSDSSGRFEIIHPQKDENATLYARAVDKENGFINVSLAHSPDTLFVVVLKATSRPTPTPPPLSNQVTELREIVLQINSLSDSLTLAGQLTPFQRYYKSYYHFLRLGALLLPLFFLLGWYLLNRYRRKLILERRSTREKPLLERLMIAGTGKELFRNLSFRRTVREMRKHREVASLSLNADKTINATMDAGGLFTPVYGVRNASPEYLILIDRASFKDHQAKFVDSMTDELRSEGVFVDRYYFDSDARYCYPEDIHSNPIHLFELGARHAQHRLIVFGDANGFFNPVNHHILPWVELFQGWKERVLLTPEKLPGWGFREWTIAAQDFQVYPANRAGLHTFIESTQSIGIPEIPNSGDYRPFPPLLEAHTLRWLERDPPRAKQLLRLLEQLHTYLDKDGLYWLAACAAYPELNWALTLSFGMLLRAEDGHRLLSEDRLLSISRLPWFRHGYMPDWLRIELLAMLEHSQEKRIRLALKDMLLSAVANPGSSPIEIARSSSSDSSRIRGLLRSMLQKAEPGTPPRDYVFLSFLSGSQPDQLTPLVPRLLRKLFYTRGYSALGLRPSVIALGTFLIAGVGTLVLMLFPPEHPELPLVPRFDTIEQMKDIDRAFNDQNTNQMNQQERSEYVALSGPGAMQVEQQPTANLKIDDISPVTKYPPEMKLAVSFGLSEQSLVAILQNYFDHQPLPAVLQNNPDEAQMAKDMFFGEDKVTLQEAINKNSGPPAGGFVPDIRFYHGEISRELLRLYEYWLKTKLLEKAMIDTSSFNLYMPPFYDSEGLESNPVNNISCPPFCPVGPLAPLTDNRASANRVVRNPSQSDIFVMWRERPMYLIVKEREVQTDPSITRSTLQLPLRTQPIEGLTEPQTTPMIQQNDFFDFYKNPDGRGVANSFERRNTRNGEYVIDNATGLTWLQKASPRFYQNQIDTYLLKARDGREAGYRDWRIPTLEELMTLLEPTKSGNFYLDPIFVEGNPDMEFVWSSDYGFIVDFYNGYSYKESARDQAVLLLVRSTDGASAGTSNQEADAATGTAPPQQQQQSNVSSNVGDRNSNGDPEPLATYRSTPQQNYTLNLYRTFIQDKDLWDQQVNPRGRDFPGNFVREQNPGGTPKGAAGTILFDRATGLRWQSGGTEKIPFSRAQEHVNRLNEAGYGRRNDWRLPTSEELAILLRTDPSSGKLFIAPGFEPQQTAVWASDISPENGYFIMSFEEGTLKMAAIGSEVASVRAVAGPVRITPPATAN
ncbi:MAG: DUF1566 domain-containing protein [Calditrichia bacterium]